MPKEIKLSKVTNGWIVEYTGYDIMTKQREVEVHVFAKFDDVLDYVKKKA